jgi:hypothetical protein
MSVLVLQRRISSMLRKQPLQTAASAVILQTDIQGDGMF